MKKAFLGYVAGAVSVVAAGIFGVTLVHALWPALDEHEAVLPPAGGASSESVELSNISYETPYEYNPVEQALPDHLSIPGIGVDAQIQHVGISTSGNMMPPSNFTDVGWYKYGAIPGKSGSAVIDGHVDNALGLPGVFDGLDKLKRGDEIVILMSDGAELKYRVRFVRSYDYKDVPRDTIFDRTGESRLVLITCAGTWVQENKTYDERLVVMAELVS